MSPLDLTLIHRREGLAILGIPSVEYIPVPYQAPRAPARREHTRRLPWRTQR
jgi:hypothetical protein